MDNACRVGSLQSIRHLHRKFKDLRNTKAALRNQIRKRLALYMFHHHELRVRIGEDVVDRDDVGVV